MGVFAIGVGVAGVVIGVIEVSCHGYRCQTVSCTLYFALFAPTHIIDIWSTRCRGTVRVHYQCWQEHIRLMLNLVTM